MNNKEKRMLHLLDGMIGECKECSLYQNGRVKPYWNTESVPVFFLIGEAPGKDEVIHNEPFIGKAGSILWELMDKYGFKKDQFFIINSVNCRPINGNKNGKPTQEQTEKCKVWIKKYIQIITPIRGILLGSYAQQSILGESTSVIQNNAVISPFITGIFHSPVIPVVRSVHPAFTIYSEEGKMLLEKSIQKFKMM